MTTFSRPDLSDIHRGDWVDRRLPTAWRPYTRLARPDRPVGIWLTLFPCWAALVQASHGYPDLRQLAIFSLGALLMRSAGSTVNDIADRKFDGHVERTRFRPLASGQIGTTQAFVFLAVQLALAASLLFFLTPYTRLIAICVPISAQNALVGSQITPRSRFEEPVRLTRLRGRRTDCVIWTVWPGIIWTVEGDSGIFQTLCVRGNASPVIGIKAPRGALIPITGDASKVLPVPKRRCPGGKSEELVS